MIYFVKADNKIKIGYSSNPANRIITLQTSSPEELQVLLVIDGNMDDERELHKKFIDHKIRGEWFALSNEISEYIEAHLDNDRRYEFGLINESFGGNEQVKRLRTDTKLSLRELGEMLGITAQSVREIEIREKLGTISLNALSKTANALGYELEYRLIKKSPAYITAKNEIRQRAQRTMELENG